MEKLAYSIAEFCQLHGISRAKYYLLENERKAPRIMKVGSRTLISTEAAADWRRQMEADAEERPSRRTNTTAL